MQKKYMEGEWLQLKRQEQRFLHRNEMKKMPAWQEKVAQHVPDKLESTLNEAFYKAFLTIFEKGTGIIEKTCPKAKKEREYKINECNISIKNNRKAIKAFSRTAEKSQGLHMAVSAVEGVGMGVLGMGIPDIPLFISVLLRSIYEQALTYGFSYDKQEDQLFILKMIETALSYGENLRQKNKELNQNITEWIKLGVPHFEISLKEQMRLTSDALAKELLYLKFVQGMPVVGVVGGISDMVYQKKISEFVAIKYKRRFWENKRYL